MKFEDYLYYDESSPSCLRWKTQRGKYPKDQVAGTLGSDNYWAVWLTVDGEVYRQKNHRIIQKWFYGLDFESQLVVDHKNRDKTNNNFRNLRVVTSKVNSRNQVRQAKGVLQGIEVRGNKFIQRYRDGDKRPKKSFNTVQQQAQWYDSKIRELGAPVEQCNLPCMLWKTVQSVEFPIVLL